MKRSPVEKQGGAVLGGYLSITTLKMNLGGLTMLGLVILGLSVWNERTAEADGKIAPSCNDAVSNWMTAGEVAPDARTLLSNMATTRCEQDGWSPKMRLCLMATTPDVFATCVTLLTKAQSDALSADLTRLSGGQTLAGPIATPPQPKLNEAAKAAIPYGGLWFAGHSQIDDMGRPSSGPFLIYHLTKDKLVEAYRDETSKTWAFVWLDSHTLVRETQTTGVTQLAFFIDGKLDKTVKVAIADWKLPKAMTLDPDLAPDLAITKAGQIWLEICVSKEDSVMEGSVCTKTVALRVDVRPYVSAAKLPRDIVPANSGWYPTITASKPVKPLSGVSIKLQQVTIVDPIDTKKTKKVAGFVCKGPSGDATWPADLTFAPRPPTFNPYLPLTKLKVRWLRTSPPIFAIDGVYDPGEGLPLPISYTFHGCKPDPILAYQEFGNDLWGELASPDGHNGLWTLHLDTTPIAVMIGGNHGFAMAPR